VVFRTEKTNSATLYMNVVTDIGNDQSKPMLLIHLYILISECEQNINQLQAMGG
jgi:hypothetical protein